MSLAVVVDMSLSPEWAPFLTGHGHTASHWSAVGDARTPDPDIMDWARANGHAILTHDRDFGTQLALTGAPGPSVVQIRGRAVLPEDIGVAVADALRDCTADLRAGALVVIDPPRRRVRVLPI